MRKIRWRTVFPTVFLAVFYSHPALAAGAMVMDREITGQPAGWLGSVVSYNPEGSSRKDEGRLGSLDNASARRLVSELFQQWQQAGIEGIATASLVVVESKDLGDVPTNLADHHLTYCPSGLVCLTEAFPFVKGSLGTGESPILFDDDGSLTERVHGEGSSEDVLGFAGPRMIQRAGEQLVIVEGQAVLNGKFIDCQAGAPSTDPCWAQEVSIDAFKGAILHELGHFLGMDHSQINIGSVLKTIQGDVSEVDGIPTMLPLFVNGRAQATLHRDDIVSVSRLYPTADFQKSFCTLKGTVFAADGFSPVSGVNIVARDPDSPRDTAVSTVSGIKALGEGCGAANGEYEIEGLVPGHSYVLEVEPIHSAFRGGSGIEPCDPPLAGLQTQQVPGLFTCESGGQSLKTGTDITVSLVAPAVTEEVSDSSPGTGSNKSSGGCSLIR